MAQSPFLLPPRPARAQPRRSADGPGTEDRPLPRHPRPKGRYDTLSLLSKPHSPEKISGAFGLARASFRSSGQERQARPLVVGCSTETGSDAGKGVLEGFVERLFLAPTLIVIAIVLMRFAFRIGNHFGFSDGADEELQGFDANFGALLDELYPFRVIRLPYNILVATRPSAVFPSLDRVGS